MPASHLDLNLHLDGFHSSTDSPFPAPPPTDQGSNRVWVLMPATARVAQPPVAMPIASMSESPITAPPTPAPYVFRRSQHTREIVFDGKRSVIRDRVGHRYIEWLLRRPKHRIAAIDLKAMVGGVDRRLFAGSSGTMSSAVSVAAMEREYRSLQEDLAEARESDNATVQEAVERKLTRLADEVRRVTGRKGKLRQVSDAERTRVAVTNAINRACWSIGHELPAMQTYLRQTIDRGTFLVYVPREGVTWDL